MRISGRGKAFLSHSKSQYLRFRNHQVSMWKTSTGISFRSISLTSFCASSCDLAVPPVDNHRPKLHLGGTGARPVRLA